MKPDEEKEIKEGLAASRDQLQGIMADARRERADIRLSNRDKFRAFQQKLGELSFTFGAAIVPLVIVTHATKDIKHLTYVLIGVALYLLNGLVAMWRTKSLLEQDADDAPHIGLDEEIMTYPVINALNKLLYDLSNEDYQQEYVNAQQQIPRAIPSEKSKANFTGDMLLLTFIAASLLVIRPVWPYTSWAYWVVFAVVIVFVAALAALSYVRTRENRLKLKAKRDKLNEIKTGYQQWEAKIMKNRSET
jgi:hypothetical protein